MIICDHIHPGSFDESTTIISISMFVESSPSEKCHFGDPILPSSSPDVPSKRGWSRAQCYDAMGSLKSHLMPPESEAEKQHFYQVYHRRIAASHFLFRPCRPWWAESRIMSWKRCMDSHQQRLYFKKRGKFAWGVCNKEDACMCCHRGSNTEENLNFEGKNHGFQQTLPFLEEKMVSGFLSMSLQLLHQDC